MYKPGKGDSAALELTQDGHLPHGEGWDLLPQTRLRCARHGEPLCPFRSNKSTRGPGHGRDGGFSLVRTRGRLEDLLRRWRVEGGGGMRFYMLPPGSRGVMLCGS